MKPELIIFDCDGTIADTEYIHQIAVIGALEQCGFPGYDVPFCLSNFVGRGMVHVQKIVEERDGRKLPPEFLDIYMALCEKHMAEGVKPLPHALEAVEALSKDYKICVASNGETNTVEHTVQSIGMMDLFGLEHVYTKALVARGKPAPDLFLYAAEKMGVSPDKCIVIEDSVTGATAGLAAGMLTIGITAVSHEPEVLTENMRAIGVEHIFASWPEIMLFINGLASKSLANCG